jgi:hypothetical protein
MQHLIQTPSKILAPRPIKPIQHNLLQKSLDSSSNTSKSRCSSGFSEIAENLSEIRRDSQNPVERDDFFQINEEKELTLLEKEIEEMLLDL